MTPSSRQELKDYCLRKLGAPVIQVNIDDDQAEDRIDEALTMFQNFHQDSKKLVYTSHQVTANDVTNKFVVMPNTTIGVTRIWTLGSQATNSSGSGGFNMFDINYQIRLNELYDYTAGDYVYFELANQHLRTLEMLFTGEIPIRFNRYNGILYIDAAWEIRFVPGTYFIIEQYALLDPNTDNFWQDMWLRNYTTACLKEQWGTNIKKFVGVKLPGGIMLDGKTIYDEAIAEKADLTTQLRRDLEEPPMWFIG